MKHYELTNENRFCESQPTQRMACPPPGDQTNSTETPTPPSPPSFRHNIILVVPYNTRAAPLHYSMFYAAGPKGAASRM